MHLGIKRLTQRFCMLAILIGFLVVPQQSFAYTISNTQTSTISSISSSQFSPSTAYAPVGGYTLLNWSISARSWYNPSLYVRYYSNGAWSPWYNLDNSWWKGGSATPQQDITGIQFYGSNLDATLTIVWATYTIDPNDLVPVQNAANGAQTAAQNAQSAAQSAQAAAQAAQQAANNVNTIVNNTLTVSAGVVQDSSGTVLTAARAAQAAAQNAVNGIQDTQNKLDNLQTTITNNFNNLQNYLPPTFLKISGYQGATATSASTFRVALDYSNATDYRIAVDGNWGPWSSLASYESTGYVTATGLNTPGVHQITVELRNGQNGPTVQRSMSVFKL